MGLKDSPPEKRGDKKERPQTKVVVRRLPPCITPQTFLEQVDPLPPHNYLYHVKGDLTMGENAFSRTYINFLHLEDVYTFKEKFDNYVFVDTKGHEYAAVVEFAPFQKVPKKLKKTRQDPKSNTIEDDAYYQEFVANLNKPPETVEKPEYSLQLENQSEKDSSTPLLEYLKNRRAQKIVRREEHRRRKEFEKKKDDAKSKPIKKEIKPRFPKKVIEPKKEDEVKDQKKVKKYSERREERKEAQKKLEEASSGASSIIAKDEKVVESKPAASTPSPSTVERDDKKRIRNKDRPTIPLYRPGMLSKKKQEDGDNSNAKK